MEKSRTTANRDSNDHARSMARRRAAAGATHRYCGRSCTGYCLPTIVCQWRRCARHMLASSMSTACGCAPALRGCCARITAPMGITYSYTTPAAPAPPVRTVRWPVRGVYSVPAAGAGSSPRRSPATAGGGRPKIHSHCVYSKCAPLYISEKNDRRYFTSEKNGARCVDRPRHRPRTTV